MVGIFGVLNVLLSHLRLLFFGVRHLEGGWKQIGYVLFLAMKRMLKLN